MRRSIGYNVGLLGLALICLFSGAVSVFAERRLPQPLVTPEPPPARITPTSVPLPVEPTPSSGPARITVTPADPPPGGVPTSTPYPTGAPPGLPPPPAAPLDTPTPKPVCGTFDDPCYSRIYLPVISEHMGARYIGIMIIFGVLFPFLGSGVRIVLGFLLGIAMLLSGLSGAMAWLYGWLLAAFVLAAPDFWFKIATFFKRRGGGAQ